MKFSEDSQLAIKYLRAAIPTMMKYEIVPNPINYTLWYTYYSNAYPALNQQLDHTIERYNTCPVEVSESLFLQHIGQTDNEAQKQNEAYQKALATMVQNLSETISATTHETSEYSEALKHDIDALSKQDVDSQVASLIESLNGNASAIQQANDAFNNKLMAANSEINKLKKQLNETRVQANTDSLTGLANRRVLEAIYEEFVTQHEESERLSFIIMDIDKFKIFNDTHGHLLGDQILKYVGKLLSNTCPESTKPVRFGGEEFAILCPGYSIEESEALAERLRTTLASVPYNSKKTGKKIPPVTASFGVAERDASETLSSIIERADQALYAAKNAGRNQVKVATALHLSS